MFDERKDGGPSLDMIMHMGLAFVLFISVVGLVVWPDLTTILS